MGKTRNLFKKIRNTKGTFHAKMGTIKDINSNGPNEILHKNSFVKKKKKRTAKKNAKSVCISPVQFSSVTQSCPTLCDPMNRSTPGLPVHHQLPEFTQTHVHRVSDAII